MAADATITEIVTAMQTIDQTVLGPAVSPVGPEQLKAVFKRWAYAIGNRIPFSMHFLTGGQRVQRTMGKTNFQSRDRDLITHSIGLGLLTDTANVDSMLADAEAWVEAVYQVYTLHNQLQTTVPGTGIVLRVDLDESLYTVRERRVNGQQYLMLDVPMEVITNRRRSYG